MLMAVLLVGAVSAFLMRPELPFTDPVQAMPGGSTVAAE
jgi:hypothetical protein